MKGLVALFTVKEGIKGMRSIYVFLQRLMKRRWKKGGRKGRRKENRVKCTKDRRDDGGRVSER